MIKNVISKLKKVKNPELLIAIILAIIVIILVVVGNANKTKETTEATVDNEYVFAMEKKLESLLATIDGCGKVKVVISYHDCQEKVYAYDSESITVNGSVKQTNTVVTVKGEPLVIKNVMPNIIGVVVVAQGGNDAIVRTKIKEVVVTLLDVEIGDVQVFTYKS